MCQLPEDRARKNLKAIYSYSGCQMQKPNVVWFDIKITFMKINGIGFNEVPQYLNLHYVPRSRTTTLEVNGERIRPSASAFVRLRRNGVDGNLEGAMYVSTDKIRTTGKLCFEVYVGDETLICGRMERSHSVNDVLLTDRNYHRTWSVECSCALDYPSRWDSTGGKSDGFPSLEVYVAGRICESPVVLTQTVQLIPRRKRLRQGFPLDVIPEGNEYEHSVNSADFDDADREDENEREFDDGSIAIMCGAAMEMLSKFLEFKEGRTEGHLSWLMVGVRLGVGFGLGVCLGFGVGVGLLAIRIFQGIMRVVKRWIL